MEELRSRFGGALAAPGEALETREGRLAPAAHAAREAEVSLPSTARGAFTVREARSGMSVEVSLAGTTDAPAAMEGGLVLYRGGYAGGADVLHRVGGSGTEDFVAFERELEVRELSYVVALGQGVAGLRQAGDTLELLDAGGAPRLRMAPPYVVDHEGERHAARAVVEGCAVDRDPRLPWGRPVTAPGAAACTVRVSWDAGLAYPSLVDPTWTTTGSMASGRSNFPLTKLSDGRVLAVGQGNPEIFDPSTGTWSATSSPGNPLSSVTYTTATLLGNGSVLVTGGLYMGVLTNAWLYAPSTGIWSATGSMASARYGHTATLLPDGSVVVTGGDVNGTSAERYDPSSGAWSSAGTMNVPRRFHTASLLQSGKVLLTGSSISGDGDATTEIYDPSFSIWTVGPTMSVARKDHTATVLASGQVLVAGGQYENNVATTYLGYTSAEIYTPGTGTGTWATTGSMADGLYSHTATRLADGRVLVAAGAESLTLVFHGCTSDADTAEIFDPSAGTWSSALTLSPRSSAAATLLDDGRVLVAGGSVCIQNFTSSTKIAQIFDTSAAANGAACTVGANCTSGNCVGGVCCDTACTGACATCTGAGSVGTCTGVTSGLAGSPSCAPFVCNGSQACPATCSSNSDCVSGRVCHAGACTYAGATVAWQGGQYVNASGGALTKQSSCGGAWDGGAYSTQTVSGDGYVEFTAHETNTNRMVGISAGNWSADYTHIAFAIFLASDSNVYIYETGVFIGGVGSYASGDTFDVTVTGGVVTYGKNGTTLYTSTGTAPPRWDAEAALYECGATVGSATIAGAPAASPAATSVVWSMSSGVSVSGNSITETNATCPAWGAGAAASRQQIVSGDGYVEATASETTTRRLFGLGQAETWRTSLTGVPAANQVDYALYMYFTNLYVLESGTIVADLGTYTTGDVLRVAIEGGQVVYRRNGALVYTSTSARPPYPLQMEAEIYDCAGTVNGAMISGASAVAVDWQGIYGTATHSFNSLTKTGAAGWDSGAVSRQMLIDANGCTDGVARCFVQATATGAAARAFGLSQGSSASGPLDFGLYALVDGSLDVQEGGVDLGVVAHYTAGDVLAVGVENGKVLYSKNGQNFYVSPVLPQFPLFAQARLYDTGATLSDVVLSGAFEANVVWTEQRGTSSDGPTLTKTDPNPIWSAGAKSTKAIGTYDGYVEIGAQETNTWRMAGLTNQENSASYPDIEYAIYLAGDGNVYVYESGTFIGGVGTYATGDRFRVGLEGGTVVYRKNGTLLVTSSQPPRLSLYVDASLYSPGATLANVTLSGVLY